MFITSSVSSSCLQTSLTPEDGTQGFVPPPAFSGPPTPPSLSGAGPSVARRPSHVCVCAKGRRLSVHPQRVGTDSPSLTAFPVGSEAETFPSEFIVCCLNPSRGLGHLCRRRERTTGLNADTFPQCLCHLGRSHDR